MKIEEIKKVASKIIAATPLYANADSQNRLGKIENINDVNSLEYLIFDSIQNERIEAEHCHSTLSLHMNPIRVQERVKKHIQKLQKIVSFTYSPPSGQGWVNII